jgi:hypothetical protein
MDAERAHRNLFKSRIDRTGRSKGKWSVFDVPAQWKPVVSVELFEAVQREIARRKVGASRDRRSSSAYVIRELRCAHCGAKYTGAFRKGGNAQGKRYYGHPEVCVDGRIGSRVIELAAKKAGCRTFRVPADDAEAAGLHPARGRLRNGDSPDFAPRKQGQSWFSSARNLALRFRP